MLTIRHIISLSVLACLLMCNVSSAKIIYVDDDATGANNGTSWENACTYLQDALADAKDTDKPVEIRVAQGIYRPDQGASQTPGDREAAFQLINSITIAGGYAGTSDPNIDPNTRNIELYETILSGDLNGDDADMPDAQSLLEHVSRADNSYHVLMAYPVPDAVVIIYGLYISGGNANIQESIAFGGGILWNRARLNIFNCTFKDNTAGQTGGAIFNSHSGELNITNCKFFNNASMSGGAIANEGSKCVMSDCIFKNNYCSSSGGAVHNTSDEMSMIDCIFEYNLSYRGGGVYNDGETSLMNCTFSGNYADGFGGGIYNFKSGTLDTNDVQVFVGCTFKENYAGTYGGGIFNNGPGDVLIINCLYVKDSSGGWGGAVHFWRSAGEILNCTIAHNSAQRGGGLCCGYDEQISPSYVTITNSILWDNTEQIYNYGNHSEITITYSCIQDLIPGRNVKGNINKDPLFVDPNNGDYHLKSQAGRFDPNSESWVIDDVTSPCIDAGDPNTPVGDEPFYNGDRINMGAYGGTSEASKSYIDESLIVDVNEQDDGGQVALEQGQILVVTLESNPSTGYQWEVVEEPNSIIEQVGEVEFVQSEQGDPPIVGAGGWEIFRFKAVTAGQLTLKLIYRRPWETDVEPLSTFSIEITVN
jgi:predicted secreted protein